ncbi:hypothetical protein NC651_021760 [Populus alba x Populus x berolinensis]|nr:hypothetical protein NC651_021760 [Populus alba x Populus x berolinensis]
MFCIRATCFRVDFESVSLFASLSSATLGVLKCILCNWDLYQKTKCFIHPILLWRGTRPLS